MARTRDLRPGFFKNEELADLEPLARLLFAGLWNHCDREGRLEDRPRKLKMEILPWDECDINQLLNLLQEKKFIVRYEVDGQKCIWVPTFKKNQRVHPKEPASALPEYAAENHGSAAAKQLLASVEQVVNRTIPSFPTLPTIPAQDSLPSVKAQSAPHPIWQDGLQMLMDAGEKEASARSYLGRAVQQYGEGALSEAISACVLNPPVNPKAYLIGCLNQKPKLGKKGSSVPGTTIKPAEHRTAGEKQF